LDTSPPSSTSLGLSWTNYITFSITKRKDIAICN
jgi:hypothetical protein